MTVCVYFKQWNDDFTYLIFYVDDILIAARNKTHIQKLKAQLKEEFDMKDLVGDSGYLIRIMFSRC